MGGIKFYVSRGQLIILPCLSSFAEISIDIPHAQQLLTVKRDSLARFIHIIKPLGEVYGLPATSLHVFYDISGGLIAFNRKASLFLNLRFFEAWREYLHEYKRANTHQTTQTTSKYGMANYLKLLYHGKSLFFLLCPMHTLRLSQVFYPGP